MTDGNHALPTARQAKLLGVCRSAACYTPVPPSGKTLSVVRRKDELHMAHPFVGARMIRDMLGLAGLDIGRRQVQTLMRSIGTPGARQGTARDTEAP